MKKIKKAIQLSLLVLSLLFISTNTQAQTISSHFFGQNAWMPDTIGDVNACIDPPCVYYGKLHQQWGNVKVSNTTSMRYGGIGADKNMPTNYQYIRIIDSIRAKGMEPIIQVPFHNYRYSAQQAADIVKFINVISGKNVKYWSIGNEPDLGYSYTSASQVAAYYKSFASAMKSIDPTILIMGPETAWFNYNIINGLTTPGGPDDITGKDGNGRYYLDVISFHTYPFNGTQTRAQVISSLTSSNSLQTNLAYLNTRVAACNTAHGRTGAAKLTTAITEANITWQNNASDNLYGVGANSFIGGQFWAEMIGVALKNNVDFINFWSVAEGNSIVSNIGYVDANSNTKKPSFYHFKLLADNLKGNYVNGTTNNTNVKSFGSQNSQQTCVLIMNQDLTNSYTYTTRLNTTAIAGNSALKININANIPAEYTGSISSQATILLIFNSAGALMEKYEYSLMNNAVAGLPPTLTQYAVTGVASETRPESSPEFEITKVFPNPTTSKFTIQLNKDNSELRKYEIEVFNMGGQLVLTSTADFMKGKEEVDLSISSLADGMYIVRVKYKDILKTAKIVVAK